LNAGRDLPEPDRVSGPATGRGNPGDM